MKTEFSIADGISHTKLGVGNVIYIDNKAIMFILVGFLSGCDFIFPPYEVKDEAIKQVFHDNEAMFDELVNICRSTPEIDLIYRDGSIWTRKDVSKTISVGELGIKKIVKFLNANNFNSYSCGYWHMEDGSLRFIGIGISVYAYGLSLGGVGKGIAYDDSCLKRFSSEEISKIRLLDKPCWYIYDYY